MQKRYLTLKEAAQYLGLSESYLYKATAKKEIPFIRLGRKLIFDIRKLDDLMKQNTIEAVDWSEKVNNWHG